MTIDDDGLPGGLGGESDDSPAVDGISYYNPRPSIDPAFLDEWMGQARLDLAELRQEQGADLAFDPTDLHDMLQEQATAWGQRMFYSRQYLLGNHETFQGDPELFLGAGALPELDAPAHGALAAQSNEDLLSSLLSDNTSFLQSLFDNWDTDGDGQ